MCADVKAPVDILYINMWCDLRPLKHQSEDVGTSRKPEIDLGSDSCQEEYHAELRMHCHTSIIRVWVELRCCHLVRS